MFVSDLLRAHGVRRSDRMPRALARAVAAARRACAWCTRCYLRAQQRRALAELDADRLRDLGITRGEALREARKPFWRA